MYGHATRGISIWIINSIHLDLENAEAAASHITFDAMFLMQRGRTFVDEGSSVGGLESPPKSRRLSQPPSPESDQYAENPESQA